ncbi:MAG: hypothetical protein ACKVOL_11400 [Novosphingobium sp.]
MAVYAMAISGDYSSPVTVNGFSCRNCSDVDRAKRNIDPANPSAGPFGMNDHSKTGKAGAAKNHFSAQARQQDTMEALHKARNSAALSGAAAAYGVQAAGGLTPASGQLVSISA